MVQEPFAGMELPLKVIVDAPAFAVSVPPQVVVEGGADAINTPVGNVSVNGAVRVAAVLFVLFRAIVRVEMAPATIVPGLKALFTVGGAAAGVSTVKVATAGAALLPLSVWSAPDASELMKFPAPAAVTCTLTVQEPFGMEPPVRVNAEPPGVAVTVPPHVSMTFGVAAITTPVGRLSTRGAVKAAAVALALSKVMIRVEVPPAIMVAGLKDLPTVGGMGVKGGGAQAAMDTALESIVTAPFRARALPDIVALVVRVMLASARMFPMNAVPVPSVAELPTCQKSLHSCPPLMSTTDELLPVIRVLPTLNIQTALVLPPPSSVSAPVNPADDVKQ
jgi:hypothetical protein